MKSPSAPVLWSYAHFNPITPPAYFSFSDLLFRAPSAVPSVGAFHKSRPTPFKALSPLNRRKAVTTDIRKAIQDSVSYIFFSFPSFPPAKVLLLHQQCLVGGILAFFLGFFFFSGFKGKKNEKKGKEEELNAFLRRETAAEEECRLADSGTDVIVVGAGVAGAALAYTLGKVRFLLFVELGLDCWN